MNTNRPTEVFHFTCRYNLIPILESGYLMLTGSNLSRSIEGKKPVVWLTSLPSPTSHGLYIPGTSMPGDDFNKEIIRISLDYRIDFRPWNRWSRANGIDGGLKQSLINTAGATETYLSWYVCERIIPVSEFTMIIDLLKDEVLWERTRDSFEPSIESLGLVHIPDPFVA